MPTNISERKPRYFKSRPKSKILALSMDQWSRQMLEDLCQGQFSSYLRALICREYGTLLEERRREEAEQPEKDIRRRLRQGIAHRQQQGERERNEQEH